jgi:hypothetical protein
VLGGPRAAKPSAPIPLDVYFQENIPVGAEAGDAPGFHERSCE